MSKKYLQDVSIVNFYGEGIVTGVCENTNRVMVPIKQIIDGHLGMSWKDFKRKMAEHCDIMGEHSLYSPAINTVLKESIMEAAGHAGGDITPLIGENFSKMNATVDFVCVPLTELNLLLCQINAVNIQDEARRTKVAVYQKQCQRVLHDYWNYGAALSNYSTPSDIDSALIEDDKSPRHSTSIRLDKVIERYVNWCAEMGLNFVTVEHISGYVRSQICSLLDIENESWENQDGYLEYLVAFMERAASDILMISVETTILPEDLSETLEKNLQHVWENMGSLVLSVIQPYTLFPGAGRGATRELV